MKLIVDVTFTDCVMSQKWTGHCPIASAAYDCVPQRIVKSPWLSALIAAIMQLHRVKIWRTLL